MLPDDGLEGVAVEHRKDLALVSHLHGWSIVVAVASNYILASPHGGNYKLFAQFS